MSKLTAGEIVDLVSRGQMAPTQRFVEAGAPSAQQMNDDGEDDDKVLIAQNKTCFSSCSARFVLTNGAIERVDPQCCCCCDKTSHYNLSQVQNVQLSECCGWCCSRLRVHLDSDEHIDLTRMSVPRLQAFHKAMKPRIARFRIGGKNK